MSTEGLSDEEVHGLLLWLPLASPLDWVFASYLIQLGRVGVHAEEAVGLGAIVTLMVEPG